MLEVGDKIIYPIEVYRTVVPKRLKQFIVVGISKNFFVLKDRKGFRSCLQNNIVDLNSIVFIARGDKIILNKGVVKEL
jgi:hypothetical protein